MAQVMFVASPLGSRVNSNMLWASKGFRKSSLILTLEGATDSAISMRPWPTSLLPSQAYWAPLPAVTTLKVLFIAGSFFSQGDQASQRWKSFRRAKIFSGGALMLAERWTLKVSGLVAAYARSAAISTAMTIAIVLIMTISFFSEAHHDLEAAVDHAFGVERQRFEVHHAGEARVLHHLGNHAVAVLAGLVHHPGKPDDFAGLELDASRERGALAPFHVVGDAFPVLERAVLAPDLARLERHAAVGFDFLFWDRYNESIDVVGHKKSP